MKTGLPFFILILLMILSTGDSPAQSYGLGFYSHEVVQEQRTGLDLSPGETLCFSKSFEISFDLSLFPSRKDYFGYVLRLITAEGQNIDLIYDKNAKENSRFKIISGEKFSNIAFDIPPEAIFSKWNALKLSFDYRKHSLTVTNGELQYTTAIELKPNSCFKILFGANEYLGFKTTDVPPMKIRNISIAEAGKEKYFWPLNEYEGSQAGEEISGKSALVSKPLWIRKLHYDWQPLLNMVADGPASVAFDPKTETLSILSNDTLIRYTVKNSGLAKIPYASGKLNLLRGNQSLIDTAGRLINFYIDRKTVSIYNEESRSWTENFNPNTNITDFWLYNKFYNPDDSSLYIIGGYGHFRYKNEVQQYHFPTGTWKEPRINVNEFTPRYLAALGKSHDGAYILGGYGSSTGQQMLNPRNIYDLSYFDVKKKTIRKIYELKISGEDFVFANSLIINEKEQHYYALKFPKNKYQSSLQLIQGSLSNPEFKLLGNPVPYLFQDVRSFADLFYCPESKRFLAVTLYWEDSNRTRIHVYSLYAPPASRPNAGQSVSDQTKWYWVAGLLLLCTAGVILFFRTKKSTPQQTLARPAASLTGKNPVYYNTIFLFGDMQVFDKDAEEITRRFTPLIKELFLVILIYSIRWERGISSEKLKELLWFDKTEERARNNRSVSIVKLKKIIDKLDDFAISKDTGYWKLNFNPDKIFIDYQQYITTIKDNKKGERQKILELTEIIKRGPFLPNVSYEWMDVFKSEISNEIIDTCLHYAHSIVPGEDPEFLVELANYIFHFDAVNEDAMTLKCKALAYLGKHTQAKNAYENFCKEYKVLYNDDFHKGFNEILSTA